MSNESKTLSTSARTPPEPERLGQVLCFASAKGGTGKTILSATTAYLLMRAGMKVLVIDTDFSTRGLSLYLLGGIVDSPDIIIRKENCLAEAMLSEIPVEEVKPLSLLREGITYQAIISNEKVFKGGVPDDRFLGGSISYDSAPRQQTLSYHNFLNRLCERFRKEFDYIIIDTRGGFDFTSAAPTLVSDGYVIVMEADRLSFEQVGGFREKVEEYARKIGTETEGEARQAFLKGVIVNKAIFSPDDRDIRKDLAQRHEMKAFGVIPLDRNAIRAYQLKDIPLSVEMFQDSDFCYYTLQALNKLISPEQNWRERPDSISQYENFAGQIRFAWKNRHRVEVAQGRTPYLLYALVLSATVFYFLSKIPTFVWALWVSYVAMAAFILAGVASAVLRTLARMKEEERGKQSRRFAAAAGVYLIVGLTYLVTADIPRNFSKDVLNQRVAELDAKLSEREKELVTLQGSLRDMEAQNSFLKTEKEAAESAKATAEQQRDAAQQQYLDAAVQLKAAIAAKDQAQSDYSSAQRQVAQLQDSLKNSRQLTPEQQAALDDIGGIAYNLRVSVSESSKLVLPCRNTTLSNNLDGQKQLVDKLLLQYQMAGGRER